MEEQHYDYLKWVILTALVSLFGFESLRVLVTSVTWGFTREQTFLFNLSPITLLLMTMVVLSAPLFFMARMRWPQLPKWLFWSGIFQSGLRIAEQISQWPILDFVLSGLGVIAFILFFALVYQIARSRFILRGRDMALGILVGVMLDSAIRGMLWTLDLSWRSDRFSLFTVILISIWILMLSLMLRTEARGRVTGPIKSIARGGLIFGPYIFLVQHLFTDFSRFISNTGWSYPVVVFTVLLGNFIGIMAAKMAVSIYRKTPRGWVSYTCVIFAVAACLTVLNGQAWVYVIGVYLVELCGGLIFTLVLELVFMAPGHGSVSTLRRTYMLGFLVYLGVFGAFYGLGTSPAFFPLMAILIGLVSHLVFEEIALREHVRYVLSKRSVIRLISTLVLILIAVPLWLAATQIRPAAIGESPASLRVMSFNAHQGFDHIGRMALPAQADFIRDHDVDVVGLNEISRGWTLNGGVDMLVYLSQELGFYSLFGPTIGELQGNAFLSRYPLTFSKNYFYAHQSLIFERSCLEAFAEMAGRPVSFALTHLNWDNGGNLLKQALDPSWSGTEDPIRDAQAEELLAHCANAGSTILMGDMNTNPESKTMQIIKAAGYQDAAIAGGCSNTLTYWSMKPFLRLDYILGPSELEFFSCEIPRVLLSDHLPVVTSVRWQEE